ncbi:maltose phosphorylase [Clostridia bacterium]|nr:maltose phosphorylase [Clostridia bacterium]
MGKIADRYFAVNPWIVREDGFSPAYSEVAESVFSLGNEYMGMRGYFDEGYSGDSLQGSYVSGVYERRLLPKSGYLGMLDSSDFMVNTVDWLYTRITCNNVKLDLNVCDFTNFTRELDLRTGLLTRGFDWPVDADTALRLNFERFLSMDSPRLGGSRVSFEVLKGTAALSVDAGLDFSRPHRSAGQNFFDCSGASAKDGLCAISGVTRTSKQSVRAALRLTGLDGGEGVIEDKLAVIRYALTLKQGERKALTRLVSINGGAITEDYDAEKAKTAAWWSEQWKLSDIVIEGDDLNQQGIRFCIFQMHQTLHTANHSAVIGAKGLTGEAYNGNTFWDTEVYCLPFYLFNNPSAAKSILRFRHDTLPEARDRAKALDCKGAFYPIATISGKECCDLWQHASLQLQCSTAVQYGFWLYEKLTGDTEFLFDTGAEILTEICRMLATRGDWSATTGKYGFYGVMGPDEFSMMVNHNAYTNFLAQKTFYYTLDVLKRQGRDLGDEARDWKRKADNMYLPYDDTTKLFEQHDGYFDLPILDIHSIPTEEFPLYSHWSYERIYRNSMIKQPDVLMFMLMYNADFTDEQLRANYEFYEPRCIHESSLSPSVHSILASQLGKNEEAYEFFRFASRLDLDNYNRNTNEGLHTTSIAGAWMNIVYGFGGLRCDGGALELSPAIPAEWTRYSFSILHRGVTLRVEVTKTEARLTADREGFEVTLYGKRTVLGTKTTTTARS